MASPKRETDEVTPSASRLTSSLRDIGYDFTTAVSDLVDNSISAGADRVEIDLVFDGPTSYIMVADNGHGMTRSEVLEALRFGSRSEYDSEDLGRFGLGLKTASLSQARCVTVVSRRAQERRWITARRLDLDHVTSTDRWEVYEPDDAGPTSTAIDKLADQPGTVVVLEHLDRVFDELDPSGGWARRRLLNMAGETASYVAMVFHRFIEGSTRRERLNLIVNGEKVGAWNPFAIDEEHTQSLPSQAFELVQDGEPFSVELRPYILPPRRLFSSPGAFDRLGGPRRWNRQQGLYIYRGDRMVQSGGWCGIRAADEHTKLARAALHFPTELDHAFRIDVAKMRVSLPTELRTMLERPVNELCGRADLRYREHQGTRSEDAEPAGTGTNYQNANSLGLALRVAASEAEALEPLERIVRQLRKIEPEAASALGF